MEPPNTKQVKEKLSKAVFEVSPQNPGFRAHPVLYDIVRMGAGLPIPPCNCHSLRGSAQHNTRRAAGPKGASQEL